MPKRPEQFTELDEKALERLAWHIFETCTSDLFAAFEANERRPARIHVTDFLDMMHNQIEIKRGLPAAETLVARDAERVGRIEEAQELRGDRVPCDVLEAFTNYTKKPEYSWASAVVTRYMRKQADSRGYLRP